MHQNLVQNVACETKKQEKEIPVMSDEVSRWLIPAIGSADIVLLTVAFRIGRVFEIATGLETRVKRLEARIEQMQQGCVSKSDRREHDE